jgi:hypothetical protein
MDLSIPLDRTFTSAALVYHKSPGTYSSFDKPQHIRRVAHQSIERRAPHPIRYRV